MPPLHPTLNMSLHYLVKYLRSKNRHTQEVIEVTEANRHVRPSHSKTVLKYLSGKIFTI